MKGENEDHFGCTPKLLRNLQRYRISGVQNFDSNLNNNCAQNRASCAQNRAIDLEPNPQKLLRNL